MGRYLYREATARETGYKEARATASDNPGHGCCSAFVRQPSVRQPRGHRPQRVRQGVTNPASDNPASAEGTCVRQPRGPVQDVVLYTHTTTSTR